MRSPLLCVVLLLSVTLAAAADESAEVAAFMEAWQSFLELKQTDDTSEQLVAAERLLELGITAFGQSDDRIPALTSNYGVTLYANGKNEQARDVLADALQLAENAYGEKSERIISYLEKLADVSAEVGREITQRELYRRAKKIATKQYGKNSIAYGDFAYRAGVSILTLGESLESRRYLRDAADIFQANPDTGVERYAMAMFWLGKAELSDRRNKKATEYLLQALDGFEAADEPMTKFEMITHGHLVYTYESQNMSAAATEHCLAIGKQRSIEFNTEFLPVFRLAPEYPSKMLETGRQGYVDVKFTVDESGFVRDPVVIKRDGGEEFEDAAVAAVERFRYAPRFEDGKPVPVADVTTRITFMIEK